MMAGLGRTVVVGKAKATAKAVARVVVMVNMAQAEARVVVMVNMVQAEAMVVVAGESTSGAMRSGIGCGKIMHLRSLRLRLRHQ